MEINRDIFPPHILRRIQTPVQRRRCISNLSVSRERPWGNILYPKAQPSGRNG